MSEPSQASSPSKMIKGAVYVIALDIEDQHQDIDQDSRRAGHEATMRVLMGAIMALSGGGGMHGQAITVVKNSIMQYQVTRTGKVGE